MYYIDIYDNTTDKTWTEEFFSYYQFKKRVTKLKYSKKLQILSRSNFIDQEEEVMKYETLSIETIEKIARINKTIKYLKKEINSLNKIQTTNDTMKMRIKRDLTIYRNILKMLEGGK